MVVGAGIQDMDELIKAFVDGEDANYTLFNYVNEVNEEVEKLEDGITAIRKEINECSAQVCHTCGCQAGLEVPSLQSDLVCA